MLFNREHAPFYCFSRNPHIYNSGLGDYHSTLNYDHFSRPKISGCISLQKRTSDNLCASCSPLFILGLALIIPKRIGLNNPFTTAIN